MVANLDRFMIKSRCTFWFYSFCTFLNKYFLQIYFIRVLLNQYNIYFYSFLNFYTLLYNLYYFFTITTIQYIFTYLYTQLNTFFTLLLTQDFYFFYAIIYTTLLHQYVIFIYFNSCKHFFSKQLLIINNFQSHLKKEIFRI